MSIRRPQTRLKQHILVTNANNEPIEPSKLNYNDTESAPSLQSHPQNNKSEYDSPQHDQNLLKSGSNDNDNQSNYRSPQLYHSPLIKNNQNKNNNNNQNTNYLASSIKRPSQKLSSHTLSSNIISNQQQSYMEYPIITGKSDSDNNNKNSTNSTQHPIPIVYNNNNNNTKIHKTPLNSKLRRPHLSISKSLRKPTSLNFNNNNQNHDPCTNSKRKRYMSLGSTLPNHINNSSLTSNSSTLKSIHDGSNNFEDQSQSFDTESNISVTSDQSNRSFKSIQSTHSIHSIQSLQSMQSIQSRYSYKSNTTVNTFNTNNTVNTTNTSNINNINVKDLLHNTSKKIRESARKVAHCGRFVKPHELNIAEQKIKELKKANATIHLEIEQIKNERDFYCSVLQTMKNIIQESTNQINKQNDIIKENINSTNTTDTIDMTIQDEKIHDPLLHKLRETLDVSLEMNENQSDQSEMNVDSVHNM